MEKLVKRRFSLVLEFERRWLPNEEVRVKYEQATAMETILFLTESSREGFDPFEWLFAFLRENWKMTRSEYSRVAKPDEVFAKVRDTRFAGVFGKSGWPDKRPFESYVCLLSEKFHLDPLSILEKYTFEQLGYLTEGVVWNIREQTEEGRKENETEAEKKRIRTPEYRKAASELLAKLQ